MIPARTTGRLLLAGTLLGFLGDLAFAGQEVGANVTVWVIAAAVAWLWIARGTEQAEAAPRWLLVPLVGAAAGFSWRADPMLLFFDVVTIGLVLCLAAAPAVRHSVALIGVSVGDLVVGGLRAAGRMIAGPILAYTGRAGIERSDEGSARTRLLVSSARGLLLALPLLGLFGALLVSADERFEALARSVFNIPLDDLAPHFLRIGFFGWGAAGALVLAVESLSRPEPARFSFPSLGATEVTSMLGILNLLFVAFVAVQFTHLFGGHQFVVATADLTYAEYARRGFFQLITVCILALPVLLLVAKSVAGDEPAVRRFRPLARLQVALLLLILASAVHRLWLYIDAFGLSLSRVHATAVLLWIGFTLGWFVLTVLRDRSPYFLKGGFSAAAIILGALHLINPPAIVVRSLVARAQGSASIDAQYIARLGPDAIPALFEALPKLDIARRAALSYELTCHVGQPVITDWADWSLARQRAVDSWQAGFQALPAQPCEATSRSDDH